MSSGKEIPKISKKNFKIDRAYVCHHYILSTNA